MTDADLPCFASIYANYTTFLNGDEDITYLSSVRNSTLESASDWFNMSGLFLKKN